MLTFTRRVLIKFVEFKMLRSIPGRMRLKSKAPGVIYKEAEGYDKYLKRAILLLDGIEEVESNYKIGTLLIKYNTGKTYESKILKWIDKIIEVGFKNEKAIIEYSTSNIGYLEKLIEQQLREEVEKL